MSTIAWSMPNQELLSSEEKARLEMKIAAAERLSAAEIRVVLTRSSWMGIRNKARTIFRKYGLDQTSGRNLVLILIDTRSRELLIDGDEAVDSRVGQEFWDDVRDAMIAEMRKGDLAAALSTGIHRTGEKLGVLFPAEGDARDEISNEILIEP
jgi:uncharacterized membrane protein